MADFELLMAADLSFPFVSLAHAQNYVHTVMTRPFGLHKLPCYSSYLVLMKEKLKTWHTKICPCYTHDVVLTVLLLLSVFDCI